MSRDSLFRMSWASSTARDLWRPRIHAVQAAWYAVERASVVTQVRKASLQFGSPETVTEVQRRAAERGLVVSLINEETSRFVLTSPENVGPFLAAWHRGDDRLVGELLGFPACCREFFHESWNTRGERDTTWAMVGARDRLRQKNEAVVGPPEVNILLRWLDVRYLPHLPCSPTCRESMKLAATLRALMPTSEREWADDLLRQPMRWTSRHGIGELETALFKLNISSDRSPTLRVVEREGTGEGWPEGASTGLRFPFPASGQLPQVDPNEWRDNDFTSRAAMQAAHDVVASVAPRPPLRVLDLGCGNGALAQRLAGPNGLAAGIELRSDRCKAAHERGVQVCQGSLFDDAEVPEPFDLVVCMPGRFIEEGRISSWIYRAPRLLVYAYGDWLERYGSLQNLCDQAGLHGRLIHVRRNHGVSAALFTEVV